MKDNPATLFLGLQSRQSRSRKKDGGAEARVIPRIRAIGVIEPASLPAFSPFPLDPHCASTSAGQEHHGRRRGTGVPAAAEAGRGVQQREPVPSSVHVDRSRAFVSSALLCHPAQIRRSRSRLRLPHAASPACCSVEPPLCEVSTERSTSEHTGQQHTQQEEDTEQ